MPRTLRLLLVEDSPDDAAMLQRALQREGYDLHHTRVQTAEEMKSALNGEKWDLVISDFSLPNFSAPRALSLLKSSNPEIPFIVISGTIGEESAVALLKAGANDFIMKGNLARLQSVVERELREARDRISHQHAQEALRQSDLRFRRIVETAREGIWVVDASGKTRYANARMADLLGRDPESLSGASILDHVASDARDVIAACTRNAAAAEILDVEFLRADGTRFTARLSVNIFPDESGEGTLFMVTDTTEQKKMTAQLITADRMSSLGMLAAGVGHEINNPLAAIIANLEMLARSVSDMPRAVRTSLESHHGLEHLSHAREAAERIRDIVRDLRVYSRADDEIREPVHLRPVIESAVRMACHEIRMRARLSCDYQAEPVVNGSSARLGQVLLNLLVNAAQAIPPGKSQNNEIRVIVREEAGAHAVIEVSDTGCGMSPEIISRLFTPLFTTKAVSVGTGLGLSIVQRIVTAMRGTIEVESTEGKGSLFRVRLPLSTQAPAARTTGKRRSLLLIDDDPGIVSALTRQLRMAHDVTGTTSARHALEELQSGIRYDIILCDLMMPEMTGMLLHESISRFAPDQAARMVFLSGGTFTQEAMRFIARDGIRFLEKPCALDRLLEIIGSEA
ncbi:MAG: response regulator [Pseudomonadota bacterium]